MTEQEVKEMKARMAADKTGKRKFWSPDSKKEGTFPVRILPPLKQKGEKVFYFAHQTHWISGASYECLNQALVDKNGKLHESETCPVCQFVKKLYATAERDSDEWKLASSLRAKSRYIYRIVARDSENFKNEAEEVPLFYETGNIIFDIIYHVITETKFGVIVDPKNGRDFDIVKDGTGRQTRYNQSMPAAEVSPIFEDPQKLRLLFENAMKMDYNSLIEFVSYDFLEKELEESLGISSKKRKVVPEDAESEDIEETTEVEPDFESDEHGDKENSEEQVIDDILAEFDLNE